MCKFATTKNTTTIDSPLSSEHQQPKSVADFKSAMQDMQAKEPSFAESMSPMTPLNDIEVEEQLEVDFQKGMGR